ncbi:Broad-Complex, Tramtrack and Bric a brac [Teratosphaeria destructans]|uniref:Broad-Complex, Tramtrack and Bric a brac n=1 Tax=Teratosphaeria destructans TaxID=418781 RepID=A0A9W7W4Z7_9PEZI|nr:Broad-Complex, Tramtrack and Bric a brac [Teratosphaeria destructans]
MAGIGDVAGFFKSARLSDVTIKFGGKFEMSAHKLVLVQHSDYFKTMFNGNFCESTTRIVEVKDDEPFAFTGLIAYCYGLQYDGTRQFTKDGIQSADDSAIFSGNAYLLYQVELYVVAQKYLIPALCTQIVSDLPTMLRKLVGTNTSVSTYLASIVEHVYVRHEDDAPSLRKPIADLMVERATAWKEDPQFQALLLAVPQLALDMVTAMAENATLVSPSKRAVMGAAGGTRSKRIRN